MVWFIIGMIFGGAVGIVTMAMCHAASCADCNYKNMD